MRVAVFGAGPAGFYACDHLLNQRDVVVEVDLFDRLPAPYGLVRYGVAPDHQKIKSVTAVYDRTASHPRFRFFGNVEYGRHLTLDDLKGLYHQILFATGAQADRRLGLPGEDLKGSYSATEFVAWYNGHPDFTHLTFDLQREAVAVVGVGNVAVDVTRILLRSTDELARTDIADYALEALAASRVREVYLLGRRGPAQAAFTNPEIRELGELPNADATALPEEVVLDELSRADIEQRNDRTARIKVEILREFARRTPTGKPRRLIMRFLVSPVEFLASDGHVGGLRLVRNRLERTEAGTLVARPTAEHEDLPVGTVFRAIGYRGVPLPGVPFHEEWGVILNDKGRVLDPETKEPLVGLYAAGWIKRGATGVIGTNKPDAAETVANMVADVRVGRVLAADDPDAEAAERLIRQRQPRCISYADWRRLDELEVARGRAQGRPRVKFTSVEEMLAALGR
ncbi:MAG: FAD-dependent oxidoreductase [Armatimonadota bacterium]|nr:FAD-dependent oxidoreductase [Armatimonadota bacterium]MDR5696360.1 FAD-dependent oxidoreductase [Armatimonadota bacterium]